MEKYYCKCCDYTTELLGSFKKHVVSEKHIKNTDYAITDYTITDYNKFKRKFYNCDFCNKELISKNSKIRHEKTCKQSTITDQNDTNLVEVLKEQIKQMQIQHVVEQAKIKAQMQSEIQAQMQARIDSLEARTDGMVNIAQSSMSAIEKTAEVANKSMNILKYMQINHPNTPPLKKLNKHEAFSMLGYDNPNMSEEENEHYVKLVLANYENKNIANFFGDLIVNYYAEDNIKDVRFWTSDVARLCFCVMQTINKEGKTEWMKDKSGVKFTEMVINPMFVALKAIFDDFLNFKKKWEKSSNLTVSQMDFLITTRQKCMELLKDIKYNKYTQQILKVVAPKYDFDTYKKSVDLKKREY